MRSLANRLLGRRPSPALVVAFLALLVALGGTAIAAKKPKREVITKVKVVKIAKREAGAAIAKAAPKLSVASAANAAHATQADTAGTASNSAALGGRPASSYLSGATEAPHLIGTPGQPPFENGWQNPNIGTAAAGFFKDPSGFVHLRGTIEAPASDTSAFFLPPGFRPLSFKLESFTFAVGNSAKPAEVLILSNGEVRPACSSGTCVAGLNGISFPAAP